MREAGLPDAKRANWCVPNACLSRDGWLLQSFASYASHDRAPIQPWSLKAADRNLCCAPELQESCEIKARAEEEKYVERLVDEFPKEPACSNMTLVVAKRPDGKELQRFVPSAHEDLAWWRLRVDYHPLLHNQQWNIDLQGADLRAGGGSSNDPKDGLAYLCGFVQKNGSTGGW